MLENALRVALSWEVFWPPLPLSPFSLTLPAAAAVGWCALQRLQEVVGRPARDHGFASSGARVELQAGMCVSDNRSVCKG